MASRHQRVELTLDRLLQLEAMAARQAGQETPIQRFYASWTQAKDEPERIILADTRDPMLFRLPNHNGRLSPFWPSRQLKDFPCRDHALMCGVEYLQCLVTRQPAATYIRHVSDFADREYLRLLVPLDHNRLAYEIRALSGPNSLVPVEHA